MSLLRIFSQFLIASWISWTQASWLSELYVLEGHVPGVKSSKLGSLMWGTLFLQEKLTVVTSHLLLYCGSKGGFYIEILSLLLLMIYLFFCLLMILVWACPIHLVYRIHPASFHISF